ncbi:MAG: DUF6745 domain-containing protein [Synechococcus sp.]
MPQPIHRLTLAQEALLFGYRDRWKQAALAATNPVGQPALDRARAKASEAVKMIYAIAELPDPEIVHCPSPLHAFDTVLRLLQNTIGPLDKSRLGKPVGELLQSKILLDQLDALSPLLGDRVLQHLNADPHNSLGTLVGNQLGTQFSARHFVGLTLAIGGGQTLEDEFPWAQPLTQMLLQFGNSPRAYFELPVEIHAYDANGQLTDDLGDLWGAVLGNNQGLTLFNCLTPELWGSYCGYLDFFYSVLQLDCPEKRWFALRYLLKHCGWVLPFQHVAIVCDRPIHLLLDSDRRIHADGEPAIQYTDGFRVYAQHGERLV